MIVFFVSLLLVVVLSSEEAEGGPKQVFCNPPDTVNADGVKRTATFGSIGWNYQNPDNWKSLVATCGGSWQTPINFVTSTINQTDPDPLTINFVTRSQSVAYEESIKPYTKELEGEFSSIDAMDYQKSVTYYAKQFHVHSPSEHTVNGVYFDLELHIVHQATQFDGQKCNESKLNFTQISYYQYIIDGSCPESRKNGRLFAFDLIIINLEQKYIMIHSCFSYVMLYLCQPSVSCKMKGSLNNSYQPILFDSLYLSIRCNRFAKSGTIPEKSNNSFFMAANVLIRIKTINLILLIILILYHIKSIYFRCTTSRCSNSIIYLLFILVLLLEHSSNHINIVSNRPYRIGYNDYQPFQKQNNLKFF